MSVFQKHWIWDRKHSGASLGLGPGVSVSASLGHKIIWSGNTTVRECFYNLWNFAANLVDNFLVLWDPEDRQDFGFTVQFALLLKWWIIYNWRKSPLSHTHTCIKQTLNRSWNAAIGFLWSLIQALFARCFYPLGVAR
jgi:hypothetical protein